MKREDTGEKDVAFDCTVQRDPQNHHIEAD